MSEKINTILLAVFFLGIFSVFASSARAIAPVITVDAGVLPTSRFYVLDKIDDWIQKNIFTFGVGSLRAGVFLESAAEKISELQFLNAQGMLTNEIANNLTKGWEKDLTFAASLTGNEYALGRRPIALTEGVVRTMLASTAAILSEDNESDVLGGEVLIIPDNFLDRAETNVLAALLSEDAGIPDAVYGLVAEDLAVEVENQLKTAMSVTDDESGIINFGGPMLINFTEENKKIAEDYYNKGNHRNALESYRECRLALRLLTNAHLLIDLKAIVDENELSDKLERAKELLTVSGILDVADLEKERERITESVSLD